MTRRCRRHLRLQRAATTVAAAGFLLLSTAAPGRALAIGPAEWQHSGTYTWTVPDGITEIKAIVTGALGGRGSFNPHHVTPFQDLFTVDGIPPGGASSSEAVLQVTPGEVFQINVGGLGGDGPSGDGGYNGGSRGGSGYFGGGGGGGASDMRVAPFGLTDRILVGGGGGGSGGGTYAGPGGDGGTPLGGAGSNGVRAEPVPIGAGGGGGSMTAPGAGGPGATMGPMGSGEDGLLASGGAGGSDPFIGLGGGGGGGGGGWFGGGGGGASSLAGGGGGGGGSSYPAASPHDVFHYGFDGDVTIYYPY